MYILPVHGKLNLKNKGVPEVFFIGVGSAFSKTLYQTNFLIIKGNTHVMVDFGMTGPYALREIAGLEPTDIGAILPTHTHADHVGGIECLGLMNRYIGVKILGKPKIKMIITQKLEKALWKGTLRGGMEWNERDGYGEKLRFRDYFDVIRPIHMENHPRESWKVEFGDLHLELFRTKHIPEHAKAWVESFVSYGLFVENRIFFSGDTRFDPDLIELYADRSEIMFHDVQFHPGGVHAYLGELKSLPEKIRKKIILMHYGDNWTEQDISGLGGFARRGYRYIFD